MAPVRDHVDQWCHFKKINKHLNCRKMNEPRFGLFFLYQYEIHNLEIENQTILADPREDVRWDNINIIPVVLESETLSAPSKHQPVEKSAQGIEVVTNAVKKLALSKEFKCPECKASFVKEGNLKIHSNTVHNKSKGNGNTCDHCEKLLSSVQALDRHLKTHMKCKVCKKEFDSIAGTNLHMKSHTTCNICNYDFKSNFKRHMRNIHGEDSCGKSTRSKLAEEKK